MGRQKETAREVEAHRRLVLRDVIPDDPVNQKLVIQNLARLCQLPIELAKSARSFLSGRPKGLALLYRLQHSLLGTVQPRIHRRNMPYGP